MHVSLTPELERYVHEKVQSGRYTSASEVLREALRSLQDQEAQKARISQQSKASQEITR